MLRWGVVNTYPSILYSETLVHEVGFGPTGKVSAECRRIHRKMIPIIGCE